LVFKGSANAHKVSRQINVEKMKKVIGFVFMMMVVSVTYSQIDWKSNTKYYAGFVMGSKLTSNEFQNFVVSDYIRYPSAEGRAVIPLGDNKVDGSTYGLKAGAFLMLSERIEPSIELDLTFGKNCLGLDLWLGSSFYFLAKENFSLGFTPKIGYAYRNIQFGEATVYGAPPIIAAGGSFYTGASLSAGVKGLAYQAGFTSKIALTEKFNFIAQVGYGGAAMGNMNILVTTGEGESADSFTIDLDSPDCVIYGTHTPIDFKPSVKMGGLIFSVGFLLGI